MLGALGVLDAWVQQFPEREVPGYTRTAVLLAHADAPAEEVSRRIDRNSVSPNLLCHGTSMFTTPVGFSDHQAVVLQFVGLGLSGRQPKRWKFPLEALCDPEVVDWMVAMRVTRWPGGGGGGYDSRGVVVRGLRDMVNEYLPTI